MRLLGLARENLPWVILGSALVVVGCDEPEPGEGTPDGGAPMEVDPACSSVRLTQYWSTTWGWCEFPSDQPFLPDFAREGLTMAIAEP